MSLWEKNKMAVERSVMPADFIFLFMIRVDPSPILSYFYFFIRSELDRVDSSWSGLAVRVDPVRLLYLPDSEAYMLLVDSKNVMDIWFIDINTKTDRGRKLVPKTAA